MTHLVAMYETENKRVKIYPDDSSSSPEDWDRLGKLWIFHKRLRFGDNPSIRSSDFSGWDEIKEHLKKEEHAVLILPVFMYDHSGISLSVSPFDCPWDSGQVGFLWANKEDIKRNYKKVSPKTLEKAKALLLSELEMWDQWARGDVYEGCVYDLIKKDGQIFESDDPTSSMSGYYGSDFTDLLADLLGDEAKTAKQVKG